MSATLVVLALWTAFAAAHMGLSSSALRPKLVGALGERGFLGVYSLLSLATFVPLVWFYFGHKHAGPLLWAVSLGPIARALLYTGMGVAFVMMTSGLMQPSPVVPGSPTTTVRGIHRITRHALFMGLGIFGLLHLVPNGFASDVAFFGGFPVFAVIGCAHQDRRKLGTLGERYRAFVAESPFLPFTGRDTLRGLRELSPLAVAIGAGVTVALRWFHPRLFGG